MQEGMYGVEHRPNNSHERHEALVGRLEERVRRIATKLNEQYSPMLACRKKPELVTSDGQLNMRAFMRAKFDGPYEKEERNGGEDSIQFDESMVRIRELSFSGALDAGTQERYGTKDPDAIIAAWKNESRGKDGPLAEKAMLHLFHKCFNGEFLVVRASTYDDYVNGADMLVVDMKTGHVLCTFDEIVGTENDARYKHKLERQREQVTRRDGAFVKYGLNVRVDDAGEKELVRTKLSAVHGYTVRLERGELHDFLSACDMDSDDLAPAESQMMERLLRDFTEQERVRNVDISQEAQSRITPLAEAFHARKARTI
jgi:hypothetical protein